ncbi:MAG: response regulator transcription factor [Pseudooceanicola sp.]
MARILLADDHALVRDAICLFLTDLGGHSVDSAHSVDDALSVLATVPMPDLVLLDYRMPGMEDLEGLARVKNRLPDVPVALISGAAGRTVAEAAIEAGAAGFLPKSMTPQELIEAVQVLVSGGVFRSCAVAEGHAATVVTRRESEVLRGIARGLSNKEIARELDVKEVTVKLHAQSLSRKLGARNRTHAAMRGLELGLL